MILEEIQAELFSLQDKKYRDFQAALIPTIPPETMIGVRTPALRALAKKMGKREDIDAFLNALPHAYFDENQLHAFLICEMKDYGRCMEALDCFLPYVDNWATCDQMSPKILKKNRAELLAKIRLWLEDGKTYTVRFAVGMLMEHFLDEEFDPAYPELVAAIRSEEYYVNMMIAWYFATALAKRYDSILPFIEGRRLPVWTHNKAIQKAIESRRILEERKAYLRGLKA